MSAYSWDRILTGKEDALIKKVMSQIPEDALVINAPSDGSYWIDAPMLHDASNIIKTASFVVSIMLNARKYK